MTAGQPAYPPCLSHGRSSAPEDVARNLAYMKPIHQAFLQYYGLSAAEVPLLRYRCSQWDPYAAYGNPNDEVNRPRAKRGECFEDVS